LTERSRALRRLRVPLGFLVGILYFWFAPRLGGMTPVTNAVGAAIALVSGRVDKIYDFAALGREAALEQARNEARSAALAAGAAADSVEVVDVVELPMTHMRTGAVQVKVRAIGRLAAA